VYGRHNTFVIKVQVASERLRHTGTVKHAGDTVAGKIEGSGRLVMTNCFQTFLHSYISLHFLHS
jgi:hypothetical protein